MPSFDRLLPTPSRRILAAGLVGLAAAMLACQEPFRLQAQFPNFDETFELWALSGSSPAYPSALVVASATATRVEPSGSFDLAFDIDADGRLVVSPVSKIVQPLSGTRGVALQRSAASYDELLEAPTSGWLPDSTLLVNPGGVFLARVSSLACTYGASPEVYAKFSVDLVDAATRRIVLRGRINPNCGFRSLAAGLPTY